LRRVAISYLARPVGEYFRSEAALVRGGRRQAFAEARLMARRDGKDTLVVTAAAVLLRSEQG
jgi:acyl-coenzyme A thioesterase PaaI-like protein